MTSSEPVRVSRRIRIALAGPVLATGCLLAGGVGAGVPEAAFADTVVLVGGKRIEGVVVSREDSEFVVVNRFQSRAPEMTWGIEDKDRIPRAKVQEVIRAEPPLVEYRERTVRLLSPEERDELAAFCEKAGFKEEAAREKLLAKALRDDRTLAEQGDAAAFPDAVKGDPLRDPILRKLEREYVARTDADGGAAARDALWKRMQERTTQRPRVVLERARRSATLPKGRRDKVPLSIRSKEAPGGTYCLFVPSTYDPLRPTPLVVGLHGGGPGGVDGKLVTGSGEEAMPFYEELAESHGWIVVCPSALAAGWSSRENEPLVDGVIAEMLALFHVDESRIYLTGHSMGGFGTWYWGPHRAELWAAISPCAGGGGPGGVDGLGLPTYIYHGSDDRVVGPESDRSAANALLAPDKKGKAKKFDGVYTELDGVGHGFPDWVRRDIFRWLAGRVNDRMKRKGCEPVSSFLRKPDKEEIAAFGNPAVTAPAAEGDARLADLVARLERGGGAAAEAADELAKRRDAATAKAVAKVLRNKKANPDVRIAAARALGGIGAPASPGAAALPEAVDALAAEAGGEDFKLVDEVVLSLGRIGGPTTLEPLQRALRRIAAFFDGSIQGGELYFTEYEVRLKSFGAVAESLAATGASGPGAESVVAALEKECVHRVYTPKSPYRVPIDDRFVHIPPRARLELVRSLKGAFSKLGTSRGKEILAQIAAAWASEPSLVAECGG